MSERDIFTAARVLTDPAARSAYLDGACGGDPALRSRVEALLRAHDQPNSLLDHPAVPARNPAPEATQALEGTSEPAGAVSQTSDGDTSPADDEALTFLAPPTRPDSLGRLGHYEVLQVLGKGGFGIVFRAFDETLQRVVAIKMMSAELAATSPARKRFLREARAAARVRHEHVVQIYAVEEQPIPYLVMEYIPGGTLQQKLDTTGPLETPEMMRLAVQIARGLAAAHGQELIHRDIKPANILLEQGVEPHAKLTDFGLARAADDASLTQSGVLAGTPLYMAPEQAEGKTIDQRADLFSLGSVFYVMLSGRPPFRAAGTMAVLRRVCEDTPRPIRDIIPEVPGWLCAIVARLHAKNPEDRFRTAAEVADLLARHLAHMQQPQQAPMPAPVLTPTVEFRDPSRSPGAPEQRTAPARRGRKALAVAAAALLLLAAGIPIAYFATRPPEGQQPDHGQPLVRKHSPQADDKKDLKQADAFFAALKPENIHPNLIALAGGGNPDQAPPELVAILGDDRFVLPNGGLRCWMAHSTDGKLLAVPCGNDVALFDAQTGALVRTLRGHTSRVDSVAFSADGQRLASCGGPGDHTARIWNIQTGETVAIYKGHKAEVWGVAFSPDGKRAASGDRNGNLRLWETESGKELFPLTGHSGAIFHVAFSPDGTRIVSIGFSDQKVMIWDASNGRLVKTLEDHTAELRGLALSAKGDRMATGSHNELILWTVDWLADEYKLVKKVAAPAGWLAFDPDGKTICAGRFDAREVTRWDLGSGERVGQPLILHGPGNDALYDLSPDGKTLFSTRDHPDVPYVRAYDAHTGKELFPRQGHDGEVWSVAVSPDGKQLASGGADKTVRLWDLAGWKAGALPPVQTLVGKYKPKAGIHSVAFSPDGKFLASGSDDGTITLWDVATREQGKTLQGSFAAYQAGGLIFNPTRTHPDGLILAAGGPDGKVRMWSVPSGKQVSEPLPAHGGKRVRQVAFSPDGKLLATAGEDHFVRLWDLPDYTPLADFDCGANVTTVGFSGDGKALAVGCDEPKKNVLVWDITDPSNWKQKAEWAHLSDAYFLGFQPGGNLIASRGFGGSVQLWDLASGSKRHLDSSTRSWGVFSPGGGYFATADTNGTVSILRVLEPPKTTVPSSPPKQLDPVALARQPSPADALKRENIPEELLKKAGNGDPANAPPELIAVLAPPQPQTPGQWIWYPDEGDPAKGAPVGTRWFRKKFNLDKLVTPVRAAVLKITADNEFTAYLNGVEVGSGNRWEILYHFDVAKHVVPGVNVLAVRAHNIDGPAGLLAQLTTFPANQSPVVVVSDGTWKSIQKEPPGWLKADLDDGEWASAKELGLPGTIWPPVPWSGGPVGRVAISPDGKTLASTGADRVVSLWNLADASLRATSIGHDAQVQGLAFSPDNKLLASASLDGTVRLWEAATGKPVRTLYVPGAELCGVAFSPDGSLLASTGRDGTVQLWDVASGKLQRVLRWHSGVVPRLVFSPDGKLLATAGHDERRVRLWDVATGWQLREFPQDDLTQSVAFSPDGRSLAISTNSKRHVWDLARGQLSHTLPGGGWLVVFRPDGRMLATEGADGSVRLWDVDTKTESELVPPFFKGGLTHCVAFTPEGRYLANANPDGTVHVLRVPDPPPPYDPGPPRKLPDPAELAKLPSAADALKREDIQPSLLAVAGGGDPDRAPPELVAVLGDGRFRLPKVGLNAWMAQDREGKFLAIPNADSVALFDARTGELVRTLAGTGRMYAVAFSPDGKSLAGGNWLGDNFKDSSVKVWDLRTGEVTATLASGDKTWSLAFSPDGKRLISVGDRDVKVWDPSTAKAVQSFRGGFCRVGISPDGKKVAFSDPGSKTVPVMNPETGEGIAVLEGFSDPVFGTAFSPNGKLLATGNDRELLLWDAETLKLVKKIDTPAGWLAFDPDGKTLLTGKNDQTGEGSNHVVTRWDLTTFEGKPLPSLSNLRGYTHFHVSPDGKTLFAHVAHGLDNLGERYVRAYDAHTGRELFPRQGHTDQVMCVAVSPDGKVLASAGQDRTIRLWDLATARPLHTLAGHTGDVMSVAFSPDGKFLASASADRTVKPWQVADGKERYTLTGHTGEVWAVAFSADGKALASGSHDGTARLWEVDTGRPLRTCDARAGRVLAVAFSPDGKTLAAGGEDRIVRLWDAASGWPQGALRDGHTSLIRRLAFHPDGRTLASSGSDHTIRLWDLATFKPTQLLEGHQGDVTGLAWRADGRLLASAGAADGTARVWDVKSNPPPLKTFALSPPGKGYLHDVALTPEGRFLATANPDGTVYVLRLAERGVMADK